MAVAIRKDVEGAGQEWARKRSRVTSEQHSDASENSLPLENEQRPSEGCGQPDDGPAAFANKIKGLAQALLSAGKKGEYTTTRTYLVSDAAPLHNSFVSSQHVADAVSTSASIPMAHVCRCLAAIFVYVCLCKSV